MVGAQILRGDMKRYKIFFALPFAFWAWLILPGMACPTDPHAKLYIYHISFLPIKISAGQAGPIPADNSASLFNNIPKNGDKLAFGFKDIPAYQPA